MQLTGVEEAAETPVPAPRRRPQTPATAVVALTSAALALAVVLRHLGTKPLWRDEAISVSVATRSVAGVLWVLPHHDANAGLYYLVLHGWLRLAGSASPAWARGLSALSFAATAGLASWAMCRWLGWRAGAACGLLVATNPFLVYFGQEARPYALAVCLAVASTLALFWHDGRPAPRAYVALTLVLLYVDLFAVIFVVAVAAAAAVVHRIRTEPQPPALIRCWAIIGAVAMPLALVMVVGQRGQISWLARPGLGVLERTVTDMSSGWLGLGLVLALALAAAAGNWSRLQRHRPANTAATAAAAAANTAATANTIATATATDTDTDTATATDTDTDTDTDTATTTATTATTTTTRDQVIIAALAAAFVAPPVLLWAFSQIVPSYIDRYVICSAVAMVGLAAAGLDALRKLAGLVAALALLAGLVVLGGRHIAVLQAEPFKIDNAPGARSFIAGHADPQDAVGYAGGGLRMVIEAAATSPGGRVALPFDITLAPGGEAARQHDLYARQIGAASLAARLATVQRLWLVTDPSANGYPPDGPLGQLRSQVLAMFTPAGTNSFGAIDVTLYVRQPH